MIQHGEAGPDVTILLLTATIDPGDTPLVARRDPAVRLADYQRGLRAWLTTGVVRKVVFYENSGHDISTLERIARDFPQVEVEFHSFRGNQSGAERGKGYPELLGIARMLEQSALLQAGARIAKCSGRLTVSNARSLFAQFEPMKFDIMCTFRRNFTFADSRFFVASREFLADFLVPRIAMIDDNRGVFFEHALACAATRALSEGRQWRPFPEFVDVHGISGTFGVSQTFGLRRRLLETLYHRLGNFLNARP